MRLRSERIVTPAGVVSGEVVVNGGRIASIGPPGRAGAGAAGAGGETVDLGDAWVLPGFIDTHVHGGGGAQCNTTDPDELRAVTRFHARHGTTALLATTVSAPLDELVESLRTIAAVSAAQRAADGATVLGAHLEGPFISSRWPGAMDASTFLEPDEDSVERLFGAGSVKWLTLAPELPDGVGLVERVTKRGAVAAIGHSDATGAQVRAAVGAGARAATHTFNAMRPLHHREPGVVGAVLDLAAVSCELICDGVHVDPAVLRIAVRAKGRRGVRLVTDAMQAAGMADGDYLLGGARVTVRDGRALLAEAPETIAGSTLTMDAAVGNAVRLLGVGVPEASVMASGNPARLLGLHERTGALVPGLDADIVVLNDDLRILATMVAGAWVHGPGTAAR